MIVCYDDNQITIDGDTSLSFTEDVLLRYQAYGWHVQEVSDANDLDSVRSAIEAAKLETSKPSIIKVNRLLMFCLILNYLFFNRFAQLLVLEGFIRC